MTTSALLPLAQTDWDGHMDGGWWILMAIGMVLFWGLAIFGIVWVVRELGSQREHHGHPDQGAPLAILDRRLAEGTISTEEYRERRAILSGAPPDGSDP
ncbi:MAG: SHOCT domain-containing protein [Solirubrobacterales bacterium]